MISRKRFFVGFLLVTLVASNAQAGFWSSLRSIKNIEMPKVITENVKKLTRFIGNSRAVEIIQNNPKAAIGVGLGLVATPVVAWVAGKLLRKPIQYNKSTKSQTRKISPALSNGFEENMHKKAMNDFYEKNTKSSKKQKDKEKSKSVWKKSTTPKYARPNTTCFAATRNIANTFAEKEKESEKDVSELSEEESSSEDMSDFQGTVDSFNPYVQSFVSAKLIGVDENNYQLKPIASDIKISQKIDTVEISADNVEKNGESSITDSWIEVKKPSYECTLLTPNFKIQKGKILLICPLANKNTEERSNTNFSDKFKRDCIEFGKHLVVTLKKQVDVIVFDWDTDLDVQTHETSQLAKLIEQRKGLDRLNTIWTIAHGTSCQLINQLPKKLEKNIVIGIHISSPMDNLPNEVCFKKLYNFYSTADTEQGKSTWTSTRHYGTENANEVHNVRVQESGNGLASSNELRRVLDFRNLITLMFDIDTHYCDINLLDACCFTSKDFYHDYPMVAIRHIDSQKDISDKILRYHNYRNEQFKKQYDRTMQEKEGMLQQMGSRTIAAVTDGIQNKQVQTAGTYAKQALNKATAAVTNGETWNNVAAATQNAAKTVYGYFTQKLSETPEEKDKQQSEGDDSNVEEPLVPTNSDLLDNDINWDSSTSDYLTASEQSFANEEQQYPVNILPEDSTEEYSE